MASEGPSYDFVDRLEDRYICLVCMNLLTEPVLVECCGRHYCEKCFKNGKRRRCPLCGQNTPYMKDRGIVRDIKLLKVYCPNKEKGCTWVGELSTQVDHIQSHCGYVTVSCPRKCKESLFRKDLEAHKSHNCLCRAYRCEHCGNRGTYHSITGECGQYGPCRRHGDGHYSECPRYPLHCPNNCSETRTFKRKDIPNHRKRCPLEPVDCSFSEVGCTENMARRDMERHETTSDHHHLVLMMRAFKELKVSFQQQETRIMRMMPRQSAQSPFMLFLDALFDDNDRQIEQPRPVPEVEIPSHCIFD